MYNTRAEMLFWLSVMCDHAIFLQSALSSKEKTIWLLPHSPGCKPHGTGRKILPVKN
ncbi:hypothetical protein [Caldicoprobacter faecalis]|uniref:hypothetical protein n=1 Tax=Caldicoprobacter faecalis TaxID=937334 RepID=UPI0015A6206A|nr:hypothetical protein [Caldicoprobacter faecalis]